MALNEEFLEAEGISKEVAEKILKEYESDTTGLKVKRDELFAANKTLKEQQEKFAADYEVEKTAFKAQIEDLETKLKTSSSDEVKAYYEAEIKKANDGFAAKISEAEKLKADLENNNKTLSERYVRLWKATELDKAMDKIQNIDPAQRGILRDLFWVRFEFDTKSIDGEEKLLNKDHKTIQDVLSAYVMTDEGKRFLLNTNDGGGAPGSSGVKPHTGNPWAKETINLTEQARILKENPTLAANLKAQAGQT